MRVSLQQALGPTLPLRHYLMLLKPRETSLLTFIGVFSAIVAAKGDPSALTLGLVFLAVLLGAAGVNGLTNYLDRKVDARMARTCGRPFPAGRIKPPEKALPLLVVLVVVGLGIAWRLSQLAFIAGVAGTVSALIFRKSGFTHLLGAVSGVAPVLVGWAAVDSSFSWTIVSLSVLIAVWIPLHVWSVMLAHRDDYLRAGLSIFPLTWRQGTAVGLLLVLSVALYGASWWLYFSGGFGAVYLIAANLLGVKMVIAAFRLVRWPTSSSAWLVYKLSSFPYLGLLFLFMAVDLWLG